jgi:chromosome segregation ATPase
MDTPTALEALKNENASALESMKGELDAAPAIYAELLDPAREPQPGDVEQLKAVMAVLGLTVADVEAHAQARREAARLDELTPKIDALEEETQQAYREFLDADEEFRAIERKWQETRAAMLLRNRSLEGQGERLRDQQDRIKDLRKKHPLAFGQPEPPKPTPEPIQYVHPPHGHHDTLAI